MITTKHNSCLNRTLMLLALLILFSCNNSAANDTNQTLITVNDEDEDAIRLIDITRFFNEPLVEKDVENFKKTKYEIRDNSFVINGEKGNFKVERLAPEKVLGKGSLYDYFKKHINDKFGLTLGREVTYLNVDYEDAATRFLKRYFLRGESAIMIDNYVFLYTNDHYLLTFNIPATVIENLKADKNPSILEFTSSILPYDRKLDIQKITYQKLNPREISGIEQFACGEESLRYVTLDNIGSVKVILVPMDCGDFPYRFFLLTIVENKVVSNLYVEGEAYEPDGDGVIENTSFSIDKQSTLTVNTKNKDFIKAKNELIKYKLSNKGELIKL